MTFALEPWIELTLLWQRLESVLGVDYQKQKVVVDDLGADQSRVKNPVAWVYGPSSSRIEPVVSLILVLAVVFECGVSVH